MWIREIVNGLVDTYNTRDIYKLIEHLGIILIKKDLNNKKGRFFRDSLGNEFIFVSNSLNEYEERAILTHELGHAILHTDFNVQYYTSTFISKSKVEKQANIFAAELLIPDDLTIHMDINDALSIQTLSSILKVPEEFIKIKFKDYKGGIYEY